MTFAGGRRYSRDSRHRTTSRSVRGWLARPFVAFLAVLAVLTVFWAPAVSRADVEDELPRLGAESARLKRAATKLDDLLIGTRQLRGPQYVVDRLTEGELYYRLRDYTRASILFTDLVDNFRDDPSYPDALFFLGDSLFLAGDYLGYVETRERMAEVAGETARTYYGPELADRLVGAVKLSAAAARGVEADEDSRK